MASPSPDAKERDMTYVQLRPTPPNRAANSTMLSAGSSTTADPRSAWTRLFTTLRFALATAPASLAVIEEIAREAAPVSQGRPPPRPLHPQALQIWNEVLHNSDPDPTASQVVVEKYVELSSPEYDEFAKNLLVDRPLAQGPRRLVEQGRRAMS
jgi:hypothetical protein